MLGLCHFCFDFSKKTFCNIAKFRKKQGKKTESQHFSVLKFLDGQDMTGQSLGLQSSNLGKLPLPNATGYLFVIS